MAIMLAVRFHPLAGSLDRFAVGRDSSGCRVVEAAAEHDAPGPNPPWVGEKAVALDWPGRARRNDSFGDGVQIVESLRRLEAELIEDIFVVVQRADVEAVAQGIQPVAITSECQGCWIKPALERGRFGRCAEFIEGRQGSAGGPIGHDRIVLIDHVGRISAGNRKKELHVAIRARHGNRAHKMLVLAGVEPIDDGLDHGAIFAAPKVPEDHLAAAGWDLLAGISCVARRQN